MKNKLLFLFFCSVLILSAQKRPDLLTYKNIDDKVSAWDTYCNSLIETENYSRLLNEANEGIKLAKSNPKYLSIFFFYKGYGYEYDHQYENAIIYFEKSLKLAQSIKFMEQETESLMRLNYMYYSTKRYQKRKALIDYIKKIVDTVKDTNSKAILLGSLGEYYMDRSEYENFIIYKTKAIDFLLKDKNKDDLKKNNIGVSYLQIAGIYNDMKQYKKAIEYCNYAGPFLIQSDAKAFLYNLLIEAYVSLGKIASAEKYYQELYKTAGNNPLLYLNISCANRNMSDFYLKKDELRNADDYADKAILFAKKSNDGEILMEANTTKGKVLYKQKKYSDAIKILEQTINSAYIYDKRFFADINKQLSDNYAAQKQWRQAYSYYKIYNQINDSLSTESGKQSLANAEARFQNKIKQQEIKTLQNENAIHELNIKNAKKQKVYLIFGLIFIGIIGSLLYYQNKSREKANKRLLLLNKELNKADKIKMQFFGILNHDLRSPIISLINFLHLQKEAPESIDNETKNRLQRQTTKATEQLLEQMEDLLLWSKGQMENFVPDFKKYEVEKIFFEMKKEFDWAENIEIIMDYPEKMSVATDKEYLKTIIRNLISNSIKVLQDKPGAHIFCKAWEEMDEDVIEISDNGGGANLEKFRALYEDNTIIGIREGLGLHVIRDLCKAIKCNIEVKSDLAIGETYVYLRIRKA